MRSLNEKGLHSQAALPFSSNIFLSSLPIGLCPDWVEWDPRNKLANTTEAMTLADDHLGVAQVGDCGVSIANECFFCMFSNRTFAEFETQIFPLGNYFLALHIKKLHFR